MYCLEALKYAKLAMVNCFDYVLYELWKVHAYLFIRQSNLIGCFHTHVLTEGSAPQ